MFVVVVIVVVLLLMLAVVVMVTMILMEVSEFVWLYCKMHTFHPIFFPLLTSQVTSVSLSSPLTAPPRPRLRAPLPATLALKFPALTWPSHIESQSFTLSEIQRENFNLRNKSVGILC